MYKIPHVTGMEPIEVRTAITSGSESPKATPQESGNYIDPETGMDTGGTREQYEEYLEIEAMKDSIDDDY